MFFFRFFPTGVLRYALIRAIKIGTLPSRIVPEKPNFENLYLEKKLFFES